LNPYVIISQLKNSNEKKSLEINSLRTELKQVSKYIKTVRQESKASRKRKREAIKRVNALGDFINDG